MGNKRIRLSKLVQDEFGGLGFSYSEEVSYQILFSFPYLIVAQEVTQF